MGIFKRIVNYFKNIFMKNEKVKEIEAPKYEENLKTRNDFIEKLKVNIIEKRKNKKIETLICEGDGLGIKNKITY